MTRRTNTTPVDLEKCWRLWTLILGCLISGCSFDVEDRVESRQEPIINGKQDHGHPFVGLVRAQGKTICTGTLIGARVVLTAAHCVTNDARAPHGILAPLSFLPGDGSGAEIPVAAAVVHPGYRLENMVWKADLALIFLKKPVSGVVPVTLSSSPPRQGEEVVLVGYGYTSENNGASFGTKRKTTNTIGQVTDHLISFHGVTGSLGNICFGDSGGPSLAVRDGHEVQVGLHSYGEGACGDIEHDQRVDRYRPWIDQQTGFLETHTLSLALEGPPGELPEIRGLDGCQMATVGAVWPAILVFLLPLIGCRGRRR